MSTRVARSRRAVAVLVALTALAPLACAPKEQKEAASTTSAKDVTTTTLAIPADEVVDMTGKPTVTIVARDNEMVPQYVEITAGTKVNFVNEGRNRHDLVPATDGAFPGVTQADFGPGRTHVVTFADPGDFPYYCSVHGTMKHGMNGAVRVVAAA